MRRVIPSLCACWFAWCTNNAVNMPNTAPLVVGMTPHEAALALGMPLMHLSGRRGSEIFYAAGPEGIPGFYPSETVLALQFRRGRLTGWKQDWYLRRPWPY